MGMLVEEMKLKWLTVLLAAILDIYVARPGQADVIVGMSIGIMDSRVFIWPQAVTTMFPKRLW